MNNLILILLLSLFYSCTSRKTKYPATHIRPKVTVINDRLNNNLYVSTQYSNVQEHYIKWIKEGRINKDKSLSCFGSDKSVNYISLNDSAITALRTYAAEQDFSVEYKVVNSNVNGNYGNIASETKKSDLRVKREQCFIRFEGYSEYVISEIYY